jgi:predicted glycosyltransferase involved in capsule biosynthesis
MVSIVTIVDLSLRAKQIEERVLSLINSVAESEFSFFIAHADRGTRADYRFKKIVSVFPNVFCISVNTSGADIELSRLRNEAVKCIGGGIVLLLDVDIYPDLRLFKSLAALVEAGNPVVIAPCVYLTSSGTRLIQEPLGPDMILDSSLNFCADYVLHWALPSSVMAFDYSNYIAIGGFYEGYVGHGYEDFDFMLRLALHAGVINASSELLIDSTYRAPLLSIGFRAILARLCLSNLLDKNIAFHLFHGKDLLSNYYKRRKSNAEIFNFRFKEIVSFYSYSKSQQSTRALIDDFFIQCDRRGANPSAFYSLFDARPRHLLVDKTWLMRLRRQINRLLA